VNAVILFSGGLDSTTTLAIAIHLGYECYVMSLNYGQRHKVEVDAAKRIIDTLPVREHKIIDIDLSQIGGSALTDKTISVPESPTQGIPITYVPARNTIFLSLALGWAETLDASDIFIGVNAVDYSGYPDCRPEYIHAYEELACLATKTGIEGTPFKIHTPLINLSKADIIRKGVELDVDFSLTVSCYQADENGYACGKCESCRFRKEGFLAADIPDPTRYVQTRTSD
jgi:7-cyano-7-deazaguanine synthase